MLGVETKNGHDESIKQLDNRVTTNANFNLQSPQSPSSFASFFLSSNPYKLSLCDEKKDKFEKEKYAIRDGSVHIYISSSRGFRDSTFRVDTNLPVSLVSLAPPKLAIKLHPRTRGSKKPRSLRVPFEFSNRRGEKFKYKIESDT